MSEVSLHPLNRLTALSSSTDKALVVVGNGEGDDSDEFATALGATSNSFISAGKGKLLKSDSNGDVILNGLSAAGSEFSTIGITDGTDTITIDPGSSVTGDRTWSTPDVSGVMSVVTSYADETAANAAEAANVVYYNEATGKFQITTA